MGSENISGATKYFSGSIQMFTDYFPTWTAIHSALRDLISKFPACALFFFVNHTFISSYYVYFVCSVSYENDYAHVHML